MGKIILFSGTHGVGKGCFLKENSFEGIRVFTASELIKEFKQTEEDGYKQVENVEDNQNILLKALQIKYDRENMTIILDGHLCLINKFNKIERIPEGFFLNAKIKGIIILQGNVPEIKNNLMKRDGQEWDAAFINMIQDEEKKYAEFLYDKYRIPFIVINNKCNNFKKVIADILEM